MNGRETIFSILNYYNENKIDFDVYIVADAQFKTCKYMSEQIYMLMKTNFFHEQNLLKLFQLFLIVLDLLEFFILR